MKEKLQTVLKAVDARSGAYIRLWERICAIESPTWSKEAVDQVGETLAGWAARLGWQTERFPVENSGDCWCLTLCPDAPGRPAALSGHMDTVHAPGAFGPDPVRTEGDWLWGPGTADDKGGIVLGMLAMDALAAAGFNRRPVRLLLQSDEENGSVQCGRRSIDYICRRARECAAFFNLEPAKRGTVTVCRKGIVHLQLDISGRGAHAAWCCRGASAVTEAARIILELEKLKDEGGVTCTCGVVSGGTAINSVPEHCTVLADLRYFTAEQQAWARRRVDEIIRTGVLPGTTCAVTELSCRIPMEYTDANRRLLTHMNAIFTACGMPEAEGEPRYGGSDAAEVSAEGVPTVDAMGVEGSDTHSIRERAYIPSLAAGAGRLAAVLLNFDDAALG